MELKASADSMGNCGTGMTLNFYSEMGKKAQVLDFLIKEPLEGDCLLDEAWPRVR